MFCKQCLINEVIDSFHIVSGHAPTCLVPRYLREIKRERATFIRLPYITQWNMENISIIMCFANVPNMQSAPSFSKTALSIFQLKSDC